MIRQQNTVNDNSTSSKIGNTAIDELNRSAYSVRYSNPNKSITDAGQALTLAQDSNYIHGQHVARMNIAFAHFILSKDFPILLELTEVCSFLEKEKVIPEYPVVLNYLGNVYDNYGEYQKGLSLCHEALKLAHDYGLKEVEGDTYSTIGLIMSRISDFSGAINSFQKSYEIRKELGHSAAMASSLNLLARTYALSNQFEMSEQFYHQAIDLRIAMNELGALPWSYIGLASLYEKKKEYTESIAYYSKSLENAIKNCDNRCMLHSYLGLGRIYIELNYPSKTKEYVDNAILLAQQLNANPLLYEGYEILSRYYEAIGNMKEAFANFKTYHQLRESVLNAQTHSMLKNQQLSFEIEKVQKDTEIFQLRNIELKNALDILEKRTHEIIDSIDYAKNIQNALLPPTNFLNSILGNYFIYYNPKDIVSGDFYWAYKKGNRTYAAVADCTGHGVPGGFMSVLGMNLLNEIAHKNNVQSSNEILNELRKRIIESLRQSVIGPSLKDGMDIALICIDSEKKQIEFSGAFNSLYVVYNNELSEYKADRMPIGIFDNLNQHFTLQVIPIQQGMQLYMFSDGYMDQFGGANEKKLKAKSFKEIILKISREDILNQRIMLDDAYHDWKQKNMQVDDILVMGIKI